MSLYQDSSAKKSCQVRMISLDATWRKGNSDYFFSKLKLSL